ncbi:nucleotidyl transferase AbiEii/AbiGii toxin family protein [Mycobacterium attenuatum]|uniref:nucleotidyl transferase AbiEii/AbiGii toxin family protein n=1 Tax=Mycobacterium attenuatum TaxID=2341086 RepID=UPI001FCE5DA2|nr:nucleotidyl transferase AbiEii/AbiGii toxin family protein [Mycobacterium attenuatum]
MTRSTPAGEAYLDLQRQARQNGRLTAELFQLYALEGFLARLEASPARDHFVLKGGVLLAAFGNRRPTRDIDLSGVDLNNDAATILNLIRSVLAIPLLEDDGLIYQADSASAEVIREEDNYAGVRVSATATLARARLTFHVDVSVGDPIYPEPGSVAVPRLRGGQPITLTGYPMAMVHAEKIVTAVQRGTANTRWRDFGDIWTLSRHHPTTGVELHDAITAVAAFRNATLLPLDEVLDGYDTIGQAKWAQWRQKNACDWLPEQFGDVLGAVIAFAGPALTGHVDGQNWDPRAARWG